MQSKTQSKSDRPSEGLLSRAAACNSPAAPSRVRRTKRGQAGGLNSRSVRLAAVWALAVVLSGCAQMNNPYKDSSAAIDADMTSASAEGYQGKAEFPGTLRRTWAPAVVRYENGAVTHWPLGFEDPFETKGNSFYSPEDRDEPDNVFAWNSLDYLHFVYGPGRMFINMLGISATLVHTPPGMLMESDGRISKGLLGYDYDSTESDLPTREPPDVSRINKDVPDELEEAAETAAE